MKVIVYNDIINGKKMVFDSFCEDDTIRISKDIASKLKAGDVITLDGDLGTGKTVMTKGICDALGVKDLVKSPTFNIINEYSGKHKVYHLDVYRIADPDELYDIGFYDFVNGDDIVLIEWGNLVKEYLPAHISINIYKDLEKGFDYRKIVIEGND